MYDDGENPFLTFKTKIDYLEKKRKIIYEGEEAFLIRSKPFHVLKTKNRVICGNLQNRFRYIDY